MQGFPLLSVILLFGYACNGRPAKGSDPTPKTTVSDPVTKQTVDAPPTDTAIAEAISTREKKPEKINIPSRSVKAIALEGESQKIGVSSDPAGKETNPPPAPLLTTPVFMEVPPAGPATGPGSESPNRPDHSTWDLLLRRFVSADGKVNYQGLKKEQKAVQDYLDHLSEHPAQADWSRAEQMAFWINAYNAFTIQLILQAYPVKSIRDLHNGNPWDLKWIPIGGKIYSLNNIEHDILRPTFQDARIHFAVNCAARSCPPLLNKAWTAEQLSSNLDRQARRFINDSRYNQLSAEDLRISRIFEWYAADFGSIIDYLNRFSETAISPRAKVVYLEYDWSLNE